MGALREACSAKLLYSSKSPEDVLMLDDLRQVEKAASGLICVRHTLTKTASGKAPGSGPDAAALQMLPGCHYSFASEWRPAVRATGPLVTEQGAEAGLRGRADHAMLASEMPPPDSSTRIVICGPQGMIDEVTAALRSI